MKRLCRGLFLASCILLSLADAAGAPPQIPRLDVNGDPLPNGAIARIGSTRGNHGASIYALAYSPNGKTLVSAGAGNVLRVWDGASGGQIRAVPVPHAEVHGIAFS